MLSKQTLYLHSFTLLITTVELCQEKPDQVISDAVLRAGYTAYVWFVLMLR